MKYRIEVRQGDCARIAEAEGTPEEIKKLVMTFAEKEEPAGISIGKIFGDTIASMFKRTERT